MPARSWRATRLASGEGWSRYASSFLAGYSTSEWGGMVSICLLVPGGLLEQRVGRDGLDMPARSWRATRLASGEGWSRYARSFLAGYSTSEWGGMVSICQLVPGGLLDQRVGRDGLDMPARSWRATRAASGEGWSRYARSVLAGYSSSEWGGMVSICLLVPGGLLDQRVGRDGLDMPARSWRATRPASGEGWSRYACSFLAGYSTSEWGGMVS